MKKVKQPKPTNISKAQQLDFLAAIGARNTKLTTEIGLAFDNGHFALCFTKGETFNG